MGRACSTYAGEERYIRALVKKSEGKRPLGKLRCRWKDNIKMNLRDVMAAWTGLFWLRIRTDGWLL